MQQLRSDSRVAGSSYNWRSRWSGRSALFLQLAIVASLVLLRCASISAQTGNSPLAPNSGQGGAQTDATTLNGGTSIFGGDAGPSGNGEDVRRGLGSAEPTILSSDRIISILEQYPELAVELKSMMADRMQAQGTPVSANDISDDMLYDQIATSASVRAGITTYLRARGYLSAEDLTTADSNSTEDLMGPGQLPGQRSLDLANQAGGELPSGFGTGADRSIAGQDNLSPFATEPMTSARGQEPAPELPRRNERAHASTDVPRPLHQTAPYNLASMRDLYTQIPQSTPPLHRFGSDLFARRDATAAMRGIAGRDIPLDVPIGPDYVIGAGDSLTVNVWGGVTESLQRVVDRDGRILLPESAPIAVAGLPMARAQSAIEAALQQQFRNVHALVTVSRPRSVRVYVVGDVQRPGGYDISALATPLSAFYAAGGPTAAGSLRRLLHYRGKQLIEEVDLYDFFLHGIRNQNERFESGDALLVPPAGVQVAISGAVKRPAIYELAGGESTLGAVIDDAGGLTAAASLGHVRIERIDAHQQRETVTFTPAQEHSTEAVRDALQAVPVKDGDRIDIEPILPYSVRVVYLAGHVARPGRVPYSDGMRLSDALKSYRDLLPEPSDRGEIVRLVAPDLHAETIEFNVPAVLRGDTNLDLKPFDTIRILGRYEADAPKVTILGEVLRPGEYPMSVEMTAAQLVRMAGGFKRDAFLDSADLTSYDVVNGKQVAEKLATVAIGAAVAGSDSQADVPLKPGDILMVHQMTGWNEIGESVTIEGQVKYPGSYGFQEGDRLSSVLRRAGGLLPTAYPMGAILVREQVRDLEQKSRDELIRQIETNSAAARLSPTAASSNGGATLQMIKAQQDEVIDELRSHPPSGRMVIQISSDIDRWANTPADIELRKGDVLTIPKRPGFVLVTGQVYNATALAYTPDHTAGWYLSHAGGANASADRKEIFIIRANGAVVGRRSGGWFEGDVLSTRLYPGDVVVVPQKIIGSSLSWRNLLAAGQLAASVAITAGVAAAAL